MCFYLFKFGLYLQEILQANDVLIMREMFVEGPLHFESWEVFFRERASYLEKTYAIPSDEYQRKSVFEIEKIKYFMRITMEMIVRQNDIAPII